jgi:excisionase family DNA binding protein
VIWVLKNPFYAGVYSYGKSEKRTSLVEGRLRKTYKHRKPLDQWDVMVKEHHAAYIDWAEFERNQKQLAVNAYGRVGGAKSGRGGRALLAGMLCCGRCGRRLVVAYVGRGMPQAVYRCDRPNLQLAQLRCFTFGGRRPDEAITRELLRAVEPMAVEAALQAERRHMEVQADQRRITELELQQARYEATLAERRYAACDPDNRLIAAQLEKSWESALQRVVACEQRLDAVEQAQSSAKPDLAGLAEDLAAAWNAPGVTMRARQQLLRTLVKDIVADVDDATREVVLTIHWRGGQHSQVRVTKPRSGEHGCRTPEQALAVMRSMAGKWSDEHVAATLNRMGLPTGQGKTWTAQRVGSVRMVNDIRAYRSAHKDGQWLTMSEAAATLGVNNHRIRRLIKEGLLPAEQVVPRAPYQIRASNLLDQRVIDAAARTDRPCRIDGENQISMFSIT